LGIEDVFGVGVGLLCVVVGVAAVVEVVLSGVFVIVGFCEAHEACGDASVCRRHVLEGYRIVCFWGAHEAYEDASVCGRHVAMVGVLAGIIVLWVCRTRGCASVFGVIVLGARGRLVLIVCVGCMA